jgi:hypothetical protein
VYRNQEIRNKLKGMIKDEDEKASNEAAQIGRTTQLVKPVHVANKFEPALGIDRSMLYALLAFGLR